ncbi:hypothetical protein F3J41_12420 [Pantoea sp. Ap-870]|uniref:hypothetical protein n=1 Tax=unclassified Pantoea TaxID=2630326 RepID=UPI001419C8A1|nr:MULTISPECIES: hypothetical protein [unclassified Pantoea]NIE52849.1 hypothetical protein [Pantoea sp. Ap-870]
MKWRLATLSLLVLTLLLLGVAALRGWLPTFSHQVFDDSFNGNGVELGYYDLENGHQELYYPFFAVQPDSVLMTLTSENDSQFMAKVRLTHQADTRAGQLYSYQPMMFHVSKGHPLVQSVFNFMAHNGVTFNSVTFEGNHMLVTPSGLIINQEN